MGRESGYPTDQTANATSSTSAQDTDVALPDPVSGTSSSVSLFVTYDLTADASASAAVDYSTDGGSNWTVIDQVSGGSSSDTAIEYLGSVDKGLVQVRARARGNTTLGATAAATISAWHMEYLDNPRIFRVD